MKGITILVQNEKIGRRVLFAETAEINSRALAVKETMADFGNMPADLFFGFNKEYY